MEERVSHERQRSVQLQESAWAAQKTTNPPFEPKGLLPSINKLYSGGAFKMINVVHGASARADHSLALRHLAKIATSFSHSVKSSTSSYHEPDQQFHKQPETESALGSKQSYSGKLNAVELSLPEGGLPTHSPSIHYTLHYFVTSSLHSPACVDRSPASSTSVASTGHQSGASCILQVGTMLCNSCSLIFTELGQLSLVRHRPLKAQWWPAVVCF